MAKLNVLLTGANGFIGKRLTQEIHDQCALYGLDCSPPEDDHKKLFHTFLQQDLTVPFHFDIPFDYVFHLAALNVTHVGKAEYAAYHKVNVLGTENLIKALTTKKFVLMSSAKVYQQRAGVIEEDADVDPLGDYEKSKLTAEKVCEQLLGHEQTVILRPVNIVGPGQAEKAILPVFFNRAIDNNPIEIFAPQNTRLQLLHVNDVVEAFMSILSKESAAGVFNLASSDHMPIHDLVNRIIEMMGSHSLVYFTNPREAVFSEISAAKADKLLGWRPRMSIDDILKDYYQKVKHG